MSAKVLVVDDHADTVTMVRVWLASEGHIASGLTDLAQLDSVLKKQTVDVLLIDLLFSGIDATREIARIRSAFPDLQIIVMSGTADLQLTRRAIDAGADRYLTKPIDWDVLRTFLQNVRTEVAGMEQHVQRRRLGDFAAGASRLQGWEMGHLHKCVTCQTAAYASIQSAAFRFERI